MPMIPETAIAMLACARIGAVHSVVFGGFSPEALKGRIEDCASRVVITADEGVRGGKKIPLKANVDEALKNVRGTTIEHVVVVKHTGGNVGVAERPRQVVRGRPRRRVRRLPGRADERRGPAIHSLYVGLDG